MVLEGSKAGSHALRLLARELPMMPHCLWRAGSEGCLTLCPPVLPGPGAGAQVETLGGSSAPGHPATSTRRWVLSWKPACHRTPGQENQCVRDIRVSMCNAALFPVARTWAPPLWPSAEKENVVCAEYYSAQKDEILSIIPTRLGLADLVSQEMSQAYLL